MIANPCRITGISEAPGEIFATVVTDASSAVFSGHFPGSPVLPGACSMQTLAEILRRVFGNGYYVGEIASCKFLRTVNPEIHGELSFSVSYAKERGGISFSASGMLPDGEQYMKIKAVAVC